MRKIFITIFVFMLSAALNVIKCQNTNSGKKIDSLLIALKNCGEDTNKVNCLNLLIRENIRAGLIDSASVYGERAVKLAEKLNFKKGLALSFTGLGILYTTNANYDTALDYYLKAIELAKETAQVKVVADNLLRTGIIYNNKGDYLQALDYYEKALKVYDKLKSNEGLSLCLGNIGTVYRHQGNYSKALEYFFKALRLAESIGDKNRIPIWVGNIGVIYQMQPNYPKALEYYQKAMEMATEVGDKGGVSLHMGNIGIIYEEQAKKIKDNPRKRDSLFKIALDKYFTALKMAEEVGDKRVIPNLLGNIGNAYGEQKYFDKAKEYYRKALDIAIENGQKEEIAGWLGTMGAVCVMQEKFQEAEKYILDGLKLSTEIGALGLVKERYRELAALYERKGEWKKCYEYFQKYVAVRDTLASDESAKKQTRLEMQYDFDKKQVADSLKNAEQAKIDQLQHLQEIKQQKIYTYGGLIGFALMIIVSGVSFSAYRQKRKDNSIITQQKELVEEKQKEILDSIRYAKRIQSSLLPPEKYIDKSLKQMMRKNL